jgi:regulator of protease activity HflC (stomatin/prohibitin superfamily)
VKSSIICVLLAKIIIQNKLAHMSIQTSNEDNDFKLVSDYKKTFGQQVHHAANDDDIRVRPELSLYDDLDRRHLLVRPRFPVGLGYRLISDGKLGLAMMNQTPQFLAPGRHTMWSPFDHLIGIANITDKLITLGNIQIVTINQGELGLSRRNGETILLDPGRYVLKAPHIFEKSTEANAQYIELGTYRRITVPVGYVAVAFDIGKQIIIRPEDTEAGPFETNSPTFLFDKRTGFQSVQLQVRELDELKVNTRDGIAITARGLITYRIHDARAAFMTIQDIHGAVKRAAEATLTSLFLNAAIDEIAPPVPTKPSDEALISVKPKHDNENFNQHIRDAFIHDFSHKVNRWGIELQDLNIEKLEFDASVKDLLRKRAQARVETATSLANMRSQTDIAMQEAERHKQQAQIRAEADAFVTRTKADADYYAAERHAQAAKLLQEVPLSAQLELKRLDVEMIKATGDRTTFMPMNMHIGDVGMTDKHSGQMYWSSSNIAKS